jgi:crossover junction endodeoxyribonuclease RuvC
MIVIGIDPGIANTGFGVVRGSQGKTVALDGGVIETSPEMALPERLDLIHAAVVQLLDWHEPAAVALEDLYFGKNVGSAMEVGQARGVIMLAAAQKQIACFDYTPQVVKSAVTGTGSAGKEQVQVMVGQLLGLDEPPQPDHAADAFAVALCHLGHAPSLDAVSRLGETPSGSATVTRRRATG